MPNVLRVDVTEMPDTKMHLSCSESEKVSSGQVRLGMSRPRTTLSEPSLEEAIQTDNVGSTSPTHFSMTVWGEPLHA